MNDIQQNLPVINEKVIREIRMDPIVPSESVLIATTHGLRPKEKEALAP